MSTGLWGAAVDGWFLPDVPSNIFREGRQNPVPVITCANLGELTGPGAILMPGAIPEYVNILNGVNKADRKGFACIFDQVPNNWRKEGCVSFHGLELTYVFGLLDNASPSWPVSFNILAREAGAKTLNPGFSDIDRQISENMMVLRSRFAQAGNPNVEGQVAWPAYDSANEQYLYINESLQVKSGFSKVAQKQ